MEYTIDRALSVCEDGSDEPTHGLLQVYADAGIVRLSNLDPRGAMTCKENQWFMSDAHGERLLVWDDVVYHIQNTPYNANATWHSDEKHLYVSLDDASDQQLVFHF